MALKSVVTCGVGIALLAGGAASASAQEAATANGNWVVSVSGWGKWASLGVAAGLTTLGAFRANKAQNRFTVLESACRSDPTFCGTGDDGIYLEAEAERLFQETLDFDGQAQKLLLGGQVSLVLSGAMFLVDLLNGDAEPENIPFTPLRVFSGPDRIGLQLEF